MANFCLPKFAADSFKTALKTEGLTPAKLEAMGDEGRNAFFQRHMNPEDARKANALFEARMVAAGNREAKLLEKNLEKGRPELSDKQRARLIKLQKDGMINWVKGLAGIGPKAKRDLLDKVERLGTLLKPGEHDAFLSDLVEQRLGLGVSREEASEIARLSKIVSDKREAMTDMSVADSLSGKKPDATRLAFGEANVAFNDYVNGLKKKSEAWSPKDLIRGNLNSRAASAARGFSNLAGQAKSITASLDNSSIFNQGWRVMTRRPDIWTKNAAETFVNLVKTVGGKDVIKAMNTRLAADPVYDLAKKGGLSIGTIEEAFPSALPEKIYGLGRIYKASQDAYTAFVHQTRMDMFKLMLKNAEKSGIDYTNADELKPIAAMVNSFTGRGNFGKFEGPAVDAFNNILFAPRYTKSQFDLLLHPITGAGGSNFVRKEAAKNLFATLAGTAGILGAAGAVAKSFGIDDAIEWDPRSANFGAIKIGDKRYKLGGGFPGAISLLSRIVPTKNKGDWGMYTKSSTTGKITKLNEDTYKAPTVGSTIGTFVGNKFSPALQLADDWYLTGVDFDGEKPTVLGSALKLVTPFGATTYKELKGEPEAQKLIDLLISGLGISISKY